MLSYKTIDTACRAKTNKEKERKKELSSKKNISKKRGDDVEELRKKNIPIRTIIIVGEIFLVIGSKGSTNIARTIEESI